MYALGEKHLHVYALGETHLHALGGKHESVAKE